MRESEIEKEVCDYAEAQGFLVRKYNSPCVVGVPDRIVFGYGQVFLIEFKAPNGKVSPMQQREIHKIRSHGCRVFIIDNIESGKLIIDGAMMVGTTYVNS